MEKHYLLHDELNKEIDDNYSWSRSVFNDLSVCDNSSILKPASEALSSIEPYYEVNSPLSFWGTSSLDRESLKLDDVFQVDKDDLVLSPTLAELNANDESLLDSFDESLLVLPKKKKSLQAKLSVSTKSNEHDDNSIFKLSALNAIPINLSDEPPTLAKDCEVHQKASPKKYFEGKCLALESLPSPQADKLQTVPISSTSSSDIHITSSDSCSMFESSKLKSVDSTCELHADCLKFPCREAKQTDSDHLALSSGEIEMDSDYEESEIECDYSSDVESDDEKRLTKDRIPSTVLLQKKKHRFFWQYNVQSKGPKGPKLKLNEDFPEISDPVFTDNSIKSVKHAGKARRGDGNDLTPNPKKLYHLGLELTKLNTVIDELVPVSEQPLNVRIKSRKEKNKLASRACRLKKKAQHEANKVKLFGLQQEQKHLQLVLSKIKKMIRNRIQVGIQNGSPSLEAAVISLSVNGSVPKVAGSSADFVNDTLKIVGQGDDTGGLRIRGKF